MSVPCTTSGRSGEFSSRAEKQLAGRRLAKAPSSLRRRRSPASGRRCAGFLSEAGEPAAASRTGAGSRQAASVSGGSGSLLAARAATPMFLRASLSSCRKAEATASRTRIACSVTSGPMPSPATRARLSSTWGLPEGCEGRFYQALAQQPGDGDQSGHRKAAEQGETLQASAAVGEAIGITGLGEVVADGGDNDCDRTDLHGNGLPGALSDSQDEGIDVRQPQDPAERVNALLPQIGDGQVGQNDHRNKQPGKQQGGPQFQRISRF